MSHGMRGPPEPPGQGMVETVAVARHADYGSRMGGLAEPPIFTMWTRDENATKGLDRPRPVNIKLTVGDRNEVYGRASVRAWGDKTRVRKAGRQGGLWVGHATEVRDKRK